MRALGQIEWEVDLGRAVDAIRERRRATVRHVQMQQRPTVLGDYLAHGYHLIRRHLRAVTDAPGDQPAPVQILHGATIAIWNNQSPPAIR